MHRSMVEVAAAAGVPVETLRKIETGRVPTPAFFTIAAIAATLDIRLGDLATWTESRRPDARPSDRLAQPSSSRRRVR